MQVFSYHTIQFATQGLFKDKGSKFLAFAEPVTTEAEIKAKIESLKKEYFDARHHCFAWMLGAERKIFRAFDDGEPNHSAGDPILGQIKSKNLTNVLVIVVRYFGGVKLGVGGLINAYKRATEDALDKAVIIKRDVTENIELRYNYSATPEIMRLIKELDLVVLYQKFETDCVLTLQMKLRDKEMLMKKLAVYQAMNFDLTFSSVG
jgi:uncharacterized YigZ family protein